MVGAMLEGQKRRNCYYSKNFAAREGYSVEEEAIHCKYQVGRKLLQTVGLDSLGDFRIACTAIVAIVLSLKGFFLEAPSY